MNQTRRKFIKTIGTTTAVAALPAWLTRCTSLETKPNILWITSEDNSPFFGCYGDSLATTPNFDKLASEGILYDQAYASAPVCAAARNTIITGVYAPSSGSQHMRSRTHQRPEDLKLYPQYLREAGYFCTNNYKTDYNFYGKYKDYWDELGQEAHYRNRKTGQPFFAIFNYKITHESSIHTSIPTKELRHDPDKIKLPPYHPDTPEIRHDWAQYYDKIEDLDTQVGIVLKELAEAGLAEDTIVFYYADHGGVLPRSKRFVYDSGLRVPMIIRFPQKFQSLAPAKPGSHTDRIATFVDLAPSVLSLAGIPKPQQMQGSSFLGKYAENPQEYAFSFRGRMDERYDFVRSMRDKRFRYIRNYMPHRIYGQHLNYLWKAPAMQSWEAEYEKGNCNAIQSAFFHKKPVEELYDSQNDPWEVNNLASDPNYQEVLQRMREALDEKILSIYDSGFIPEGEMIEIDKTITRYAFVRSANYDLKRIKQIADMAIWGDVSNLEELKKLTGDKDKFVRYWAVTGLLILNEQAAAAKEELVKTLNDECADVRVTAAEALCNLGEKSALDLLVKELSNENTKVALHAANSIDCIGSFAKPVLAKLKALPESPDKYIDRALEYAIQKLESL